MLYCTRKLRPIKERPVLKSRITKGRHKITAEEKTLRRLRHLVQVNDSSYDSVLMWELTTGNSGDRTDTLGNLSNKAFEPVYRPNISYCYLYQSFWWLTRTSQDRKPKKSQYCNKLLGQDLTTSWALHTNVQCPLRSCSSPSL